MTVVVSWSASNISISFTRWSWLLVKLDSFLLLYLIFFLSALIAASCLFFTATILSRDAVSLPFSFLNDWFWYFIASSEAAFSASSSSSLLWACSYDSIIFEIFTSSLSIFFRINRSVASCSNFSLSKSLTTMRMSTSFLSRAAVFSEKSVEQFSKWVSASFNSLFITSMRSLMTARRLLRS